MSDIFLKAIPFGVASFILGTAGVDICMFWLFYPREAPPQPEPLTGFLGKLEKLAQRKVHTKSGTYRITAPTPEYLNEAQQQRLCQYYVERYAENHNNWRGALFHARMIKRLCGISLDDILNNIIPGGGSGTNN